MTTWIDLRPQSFFRRRLVYSTNLAGIGALEFLRQAGTMTVKKGADVVVETNGHSQLRCSGQEVIKRVRAPGTLERLESSSLSMTYGPPLTTPEGLDERHVVFEGTSTRTYVVHRIHGVLTHCKIVATNDDSDPQLMLGCLAFFWVDTQRDRNWT